MVPATRVGGRDLRSAGRWAVRGPEVPVAATGLLRIFAEAGMIHVADFHLARRMAAYCGESDDRVLLALALTVRELRLGSVCLDLTSAPELIVPGEADDGSVVEPVELPWPESDDWVAAVASSPAVAGPDDAPRPFRLDGGLLYLDRFFAEEQNLAADLRHRSSLPDLPSPELPAPVPGMVPDTTQDDAVRAATRARTSVITGGPGSGKTTVVSRIIDALAASGPLTVALTAPTGKAATRLESAVRHRLRYPERAALTAGTLHRIIGVVPGRVERTHDALNPLPFDVVIVDETSMVSITLMSWLLDAVADTTRLILIGDPNQLASVEAGAVLADISVAPDLVTSPGGPAVVQLGGSHRNLGDVAQLADAIREGDVDGCLDLLERSATCTLVPCAGGESLADLPALAADVESVTRDVLAAALEGDGDGAVRALERHRLLCAHREGPFGTGHWQQAVRRYLAAALPGYAPEIGQYPGQPLIVTRNSDVVSNGDVAVIIDGGGRLLAAVDRGGHAELLNPLLLDAAQELHAMTIHKSQGSQFERVSVVLPPPGSPLLTRELLYTAVTRAESGVRLYGSPDALRKAIGTRVRRASGLVRRATLRGSER